MSHSNWTWNGVHYCHYVSNFTAVGGDPNSNYPPMGFIHGTGVPPQPTSTPIPAQPTSTPALPAPVLVSPANNAVVSSLPLLCWNAVPGATEYLAQVYNGGLGQFNGGWQPSTCWTPTVINGRYEVWTWWVIARNAAGSGQSSESRYSPTSGAGTATSTPPVATVTSTPPAPSGTVNLSSTATAFGFSDVPPSHLFYNDIMFLVGRRAIGGYSDGSFRPGNSTSRGQFAKVVSLLFALPIHTPTQPSFRDVGASNVFYTFVETAARAGVVNGLTQSQYYQVQTNFPCYGPNVNISRGQLAVIVQRIRNYPVASPHTADLRRCASQQLCLQRSRDAGAARDH